MEELNLEGQLKGGGLITQKATLVNALSKSLAGRITVMDFTFGRTGLVKYVESLSEGEIEITPHDGDASESPLVAKRLKVVCGANTAMLKNMAWVNKKTPLTICDVRIGPQIFVQPNVDTAKLSQALARVLRFASTRDVMEFTRWILVRARDGKLTILASDGIRIAVATLGFLGEDGQVLLDCEELRGIPDVLRKKDRVRLSFGQDGPDRHNGDMPLIIENGPIRSEYRPVQGDFPDWESSMPAEFKASAAFDSREAIKAVKLLGAFSRTRIHPVNVTIGEGRVLMSNNGESRSAEIAADTNGACKVRLNGSHIAEAARACGGILELKLTDPPSPALFAVDGFRLSVRRLII
ncbi:MAG: hypothetical protein HYX90_05655 [Chloroflexi bacterium]|nr:hypothetical protein [Chloroflexota bacterium]